MTEFKTEYGEIRRDEDVCRDDYDRLVTYEQPGGGVIVLQRAAMKSFQLAEEAFGRKLWVPGMPKKAKQRVDREVWGDDHPRNKSFVKEDGKWYRVFRPIILTGSIRSCETAWKLFATNGKNGNPPNRFAHPGVSLHPHGLAIDVHTGWLSSTIRKTLSTFGWNQSRPDSEPWHFSYFLTA
jgi:hypothetical protein